ncbi:hypothetical protein [Thalassospira sp.]|uniref:ORC-CDC6 family AAA ATPase n=1 Tax=Thalassospira sp. TaxID=1912094 RepID=UPI003AA89930
MTSPLFDEPINAKHKTDDEIASTFVPPEHALERLLGKDHVVLAGPRGSGKTTLLRLMTLPALCHWEGGDADEIKSKVDFVSVFVAADESWHGQLKQLARNLDNSESSSLLGMSTFTTHIYKSIATAFQDWQEEEVVSDKYIKNVVKKLDIDQEREVVERLSHNWMLSPKANTFIELIRSLEDRLTTIGVLKNKLIFNRNQDISSGNDFLFLDYKSGIQIAAETHNTVSNMPKRRWVFLFDELEIAPSFVQESLFVALRGANPRAIINYKLALAPYNANFRSSANGARAENAKDYQHVDLTFSRKEYGHAFSERFVKSMLKRNDIEGDPSTIFGNSMFSFNDESVDEEGKYSSNSALGKVYESLANKDESFRAYLLSKGVHLEDIEKFDELKMASVIRKPRNIVIVREFFSSGSTGTFKPETLRLRSRKSYALYTGIPSLLSLCEGNPRAIINLISPLISLLKLEKSTGKSRDADQAKEIEKSIRVMRSHLRTHDSETKHGMAKSLLPLLDRIGEGLHSGVFAKKFSDQPPLSFTVDRGLPPETLAAIGVALNQGALVYVPDNASEDILTSVIGKRFRLNYLLAAYYKLPISLDRPVLFSRLISGKKQSNQQHLEI